MATHGRRPVAVALLFFLPAACGPSAAPVQPAAPTVVASASPPSPLPPPASTACIPPEVTASLACPAGVEPLGVPAHEDWPKAEHLVTHIKPPPMARALSTQTLARLVGRDEAMARLEPAARAKLEAAEKAFDEGARSEARWRTAKDAYQSFLKTRQDKELEPYAHYRLAHALWNLGDERGADESFQRALEGTNKELRALVVRDAVALAAERLTLSDALDRVPRMAGATDPGGALAVLDQLAQRFAAVGRYTDAVAVYHEAQDMAPSDRRCSYEAEITKVRIASRAWSPANAISALDRQIATWKDVRASAAPAEVVKACGEATVALLSEAAVAAQLTAVGTGGERGTGDAAYLRDASKLYARILENFPAKDLDEAFVDPDLPTDGRPTSFRVRLAIAGMLSWRLDWEGCGKAYSELSAVAGSPAERLLAARAAANCDEKLARASTLMPRRRKSVEQLPLTPQEERLQQSVSELLCSLADTDDTRPWKLEKRLARGQIRARAGRLQEAAADLRLVAHEGKDEAGLTAAIEYLEVLVRLRDEAHRPSCADEIEPARAELLALHCPRPNEPLRCDELASVGAPKPPESRSPRTVRTGPGTMVSGRLPGESAFRVVEIHEGRLQRCYEGALRRDPSASYKVALRFLIGRDGAVSDADVQATPRDRRFEGCLERVVLSLSFTQPEGGVPEVSYPMEWTPDKGLTRLRPSLSYPNDRAPPTYHRGKRRR